MLLHVGDECTERKWVWAVLLYVGDECTERKWVWAVLLHVGDECTGSGQCSYMWEMNVLRGSGSGQCSYMWEMNADRRRPNVLAGHVSARTFGAIVSILLNTLIH